MWYFKIQNCKSIKSKLNSWSLSLLIKTNFSVCPEVFSVVFNLTEKSSKVSADIIIHRCNISTEVYLLDFRDNPKSKLDTRTVPTSRIKTNSVYLLSRGEQIVLNMPICPHFGSQFTFIKQQYVFVNWNLNIILYM